MRDVFAAAPVEQGCGQELREADKNSWPCSFHVDAFAFCMAVPDIALSRAEQSVERTLSGSAPEPRGRSGLRSRASLARAIKVIHAGGQQASSRSGAAPARGTRPGARRTVGADSANPATLCPPGAAERHHGLDYRVENMALHPAAPTSLPSADRPMHSTRAQDAYGTAPIVDFASSSARLGSYQNLL